MKKHTSSTVLLLALVFAASSALAQQNPTYPETPPPPPSAAETTTPATSLNLNGKVISITPSLVVVESQSGERSTFIINSNTALNDQPVPGDQVVVRYTSQADGQFAASSVDRSVASGSQLAANAPDPAADADTSDDALPRTASHQPALALTGALALFAALFLAIRRRVA